jgi:mono/diheme cytochrome c family protein
MPAFAEAMSDADIVATLAYIKSRWSGSVHEKRAAAGMN